MKTDLKQKLILWSLALLVFLLPFSARLPLLEYPIFGTQIVNDFSRVFLYAADIWAVIAIIILMAIMRWPSVASKRTIAFLILLILAAAASLYFAPFNTAVGSASLIRLLLAGLLFYVVTKIPGQAIYTMTSFGLAAGGILQSFLAIIQFVAQKSQAVPWLGISPLQIGSEGAATFAYNGQKILRAYGSLPHPNILAFYLLMALLFSASLYLVLGPSFKKITLTISAFIGLGLLLTFSRLFISLALLALPAMFLIAGRAKYEMKNMHRLLSATAVIFIIFVSLFALRPIEADHSLDYRTLYEETNAKLVQKNALRGVGLGQSVLLGNDALQQTLQEEGQPYQTWMHQPAHNSFTLMLSETGWLGLLALALFLIFATNGIWKKIKKDRAARSNIYLVISTVAVSVILAAMFFEHLFLTSPNSLYLTFIILGLVATIKQEVIDSDKKNPAPV